MRSQLEYSANSDPGESSRPSKRQRLDYHGSVRSMCLFISYKQVISRNSFSSPRRMSTPARPDRLTFPPDHQEPDLSRSDEGYPHDVVPPNERPGSRRFKSFVHRSCCGFRLTVVYRKYTYNPPGTSQLMQQAAAPHNQAGPMPRQDQPPPPPQQQQAHHSHHRHGHDRTHVHHTHKHRKVMPPPPTPRHHPAEIPRSAMLPPPISVSNAVPFASTPLMPSRNLPVQLSVPMTPTSAPQRFIPPPSVSRLNTVANRQNAARGHRTPFIPNGA